MRSEVCGLSLDVNNLRTETYGESRIPDTRVPGRGLDAVEGAPQVGTVEEDAQRRDFTINALSPRWNRKTNRSLF